MKKLQNSLRDRSGSTDLRLIDNVKIRRSFDRRKSKSQKSKTRQTTSIFYCDHNDNQLNINDASSMESPQLTPSFSPTCDNNDDVKMTKFDFNGKPETTTTSTTKLNITISTKSRNSCSSSSCNDSPPPLPKNSPPILNDALNSLDFQYKFDKTNATYVPLIADPDDDEEHETDSKCNLINNSNDNATTNVSKYNNYVQQIKMKFEKLCNYAGESITTTASNNTSTDDYQFKRTPSLRRRRRRRSLSGHLGKVLSWSTDNDNTATAVTNDTNQVYDEKEEHEQLTLQISDCDDILEELNLKDKVEESNKENEETTTTNDDTVVENGDEKKQKKKGKNRTASQRSINRPKTEIYDDKHDNVWIKSYSYTPNIGTTICEKDENATVVVVPSTASISDEETAVLDLRRQLSFTPNDVPPIIEELLRTEEAYVNNLRFTLNNYGSIFESDDLPNGLKGQKYILLGNIEQIFEFHETILLPMLQSNRGDLKQMFDEFLALVEEGQFYDYILYTMNKQRSLKLSEQYKGYFKELQLKLKDKLGINSFLVQPIQRLARYPLLLQEFFKTCFGDIKYKQAIASCCRLEKNMRKLLNTLNECEEVNDIQDCFDLNVYYQGQFKKVNEFNIYDYTLKRSYRSKVFIFDKCIIYTEIKDKRLIYRGNYPCEKIGFSSKPKKITLYYEKHKRQECDFEADSSIIDIWINLIRDMITDFAMEEKRKLQKKYSNTNSIVVIGGGGGGVGGCGNVTKIPNEIYRRPNSEIICRNYSRISSDSGISGMMASVDENRDSKDTNNIIIVNGINHDTSGNYPKTTTWYDTM